MEEKLTGYHCLAIPGPTNMPFEIRQAMELPLEDHRAPDFAEFTMPLFDDLKKYLEHKRVGYLFSWLWYRWMGIRNCKYAK